MFTYKDFKSKNNLVLNSRVGLVNSTVLSRVVGPKLLCIVFSDAAETGNDGKVRALVPFNTRRPFYSRFHRYRRHLRRITILFVRAYLHLQRKKKYRGFVIVRTGRDILPYKFVTKQPAKPFVLSVLDQFALKGELTIDGWDGLQSLRSVHKRRKRQTIEKIIPVESYGPFGFSQPSQIGELRRRQVYSFNNALATRRYFAELKYEFRYCDYDFLYEMWEVREVRERDTEFEPEDEHNEEFDGEMMEKASYEDEVERREIADVLKLIITGPTDQNITRAFMMAYFAIAACIVLPICLYVFRLHAVLLFVGVGLFFKIFISAIS